VPGQLRWKGVLGGAALTPLPAVRAHRGDRQHPEPRLRPQVRPRLLLRGEAKPPLRRV